MEETERTRKQRISIIYILGSKKPVKGIITPSKANTVTREYIHHSEYLFNIYAENSDSVEVDLRFLPGMCAVLNVSLLLDLYWRKI